MGQLMKLLELYLFYRLMSSFCTGGKYTSSFHKPFGVNRGRERRQARQVLSQQDAGLSVAHIQVMCKNCFLVKYTVMKN